MKIAGTMRLLTTFLTVAVSMGPSLGFAQESADTPVGAAEPGQEAPAQPPAVAQTDLQPPPTEPLAPAEVVLASAEVADVPAPMAVHSSMAAAAAERIRFYGFADFNMTFWENGARFAEFLPSEKSMFLGNLNFFVDVQVAEDWRALTEVRLLFSPQGYENEIPGSFMLDESNARVRDYKDSNSQMTWMTLEIERAWLEHSLLDDLLKVRAGLWKTPYGIWNIEHATPAVVGIGRPHAVGQGFMPERQLGLQLLGNYSGDSWALNYSAAISNGRIDNQAVYENVDDQFSFTGHLGAEYYGDFELSAGVSAFGGRFADKNRRGAIMDGGFRMVTDSVTAYDEVTLTADLQLRYAGFMLLTEGVMQDLAYTDNGRPLSGPPLTGQVANERAHAVYALLGYFYDDWNTTPYVMFDFYDRGKNMELTDSYLVRMGIKQGLSDSVFLKVQGIHMWWKHTSEGSMQAEPVNALQVELAWGF